MKKNEQTYSEPPQAPEITRKLQLHRLQMIGMPIIALVVVLALFGMFGRTSDSVNGANEQLEVHVTYPTRFRYKMIDAATVAVQNVSGQPLSTVRVSFDRGYIDNFSTVTFTPDVKTVTDEVYVVELTDVQPQETRIVSVQLQAEEYWEHEGEITAAVTDTPGVDVSLSTFVFP